MACAQTNPALVLDGQLANNMGHSAVDQMGAACLAATHHAHARVSEVLHHRLETVHRINCAPRGAMLTQHLVAINGC